MSISLSTILPGITPGQIQSHSATSREVQELKDEGLVGENTTNLNVMSVDTMDRFRVTQWSEEINSQWWGLTGEGDLGKQAAGYLEQMTAERREIATDYLDDFFSLSNTLAEALQDDYPASADMDQLLDNVAAGRKPSENSDGSILPKADIIEAFWADNQAGIETLQQRYQDLKDFPEHLSSWLDDNNIDRPLALDQVVEKHRFSGLNGKYEGAEGLIDSATFQLNAAGDGRQLDEIGKLGIMMDTMDMPMTDRYDLNASEAMMQHSIEIGLRMGDARTLKHAVASEMMHSERKAALVDYQQAFQPLASAFYQQLGELEPRFSLQDMLDNITQGNDQSQLDRGGQHPQTEQIQQFVDQHADLLTQLNEKQQAMDDLPRTRFEWQADPENNRLAQQEVYQEYGLEPWEFGSNSRAARPGQWMGLESFEAAGAATREQMLEAARERTSHLQGLVWETAGFGAGQTLDLDQLIDNFRSGQPLGMMENGSLHPNSVAIDEMFSANEEDFIAYIDSLWMSGQQENLSMVDYRSWMTEDNRADFAGELLDLIQQSRMAINFDTLSEPSESLLAVNTENTRDQV